LNGLKVEWFKRFKKFKSFRGLIAFGTFFIVPIRTGVTDHRML
jgi:hypothetical protein